VSANPPPPPTNPPPPGGPPTEPWRPGDDDDLGSLVEPEEGSDPSDRPTVVNQPVPPPTPPTTAGPGPTAAQPTTTAEGVPGTPGTPPGTTPPAKKPNVALRYTLAIVGVVAVIAALVGGYFWGQASQQNEKLQKQLSEANAQVNDLTTQVNDLGNKVDDLTSKNQDLNAQVKDLKAQVKDLQTTNDQLTTENQQLQPLVGADPTDGPVSVGQPLLIGGTNQSQLNVTVAGVVDPDAALTPGTGNRIVGITVVVVNVGSGTYNDAQFGTGAKLSAGNQVFGPSSGGGSLTSLTLSAGAGTSGTILFEIPEASALSSFSLTLSGGTGPQTGTWTLS